MSLIHEYFRLQRECEAKYGDDTVLIMHIGDFLECFQYDNYIIERDSVPLVSIDATFGSNSENKAEGQYSPPISVGHAVEMSKILGLQLITMNKSRAHSLTNPHRVGFKPISFERHCRFLEEEGYTVVRCDQVIRSEKSVVGKEMRKITYVTNKGIGLSSEKASNNIVCLYVQIENVAYSKATRPDDYQVSIGVSAIDVSTSSSLVYEVSSLPYNPSHATHEIYRFLINTKPQEILLYIESPAVRNGIVSAPIDENTSKYLEYLDKQLELEKYTTRLVRIDYLKDKFRMFADPDYRKQQLEKVFYGSHLRTSHASGGNIIEFLDLCNYNYAIISYCLLLDYCYQCNEKILTRLVKPTVWLNDTRHMILSYNAAVQLHMVSPAYAQRRRRRNIKFAPKSESVLEVIDHTSTAMGYRFLFSRLLNPLVIPSEIERYYDMTQALIDAPDIHSKIEKYLVDLPDIEKLHRKLYLQIIRPSELGRLIKAYYTFIDITVALASVKGRNVTVDATIDSNRGHIGNASGHNHANGTQNITAANGRCGGTSGNIFSNWGLMGNEREQFNDCIGWLFSRVDPDKLSDTIMSADEDVVDNFLKKGVDTQVDDFWFNLISAKEIFRQIVEYLQKCNTGRCTAEILVSDTTIYTSNARAKAITQNNTDLKLKPYTKDKSEIVSVHIDACSECIKTCRVQIKEKLRAYYVNALKTLNEKYDFYDSIHTAVAELDFVASNARTAVKYKYYRPVLLEGGSSSFIDAKDLRHPLVERRIDSEYIVNDVCLGSDEDSASIGLLVYGCNMTGKTTLTKAVGLAAILAQIGSYVPAKLRLRPYKRIFTRLSGSDDILKGHSSYEVELRELNTILKHSDTNTLALLDEVTKGTETTSGTALVVATILDLIEKKITFITSTHLHNVPMIGKIAALGDRQLRICHLRSLYEGNKLVLDRKLQHGQGDSVYGLEVARAVGFDHNFIERACEIRHEILKDNPNLLSKRRSPYNRRLYVDHCLICKNNLELETHHIKEQCEADDRGFIGDMHKNVVGNLAVLCRKCHTERASGLKWVATNRGLELRID